MPVRDRSSRFFLAVAAMALVAGCSGGGGGAPPVSTPTTATPVSPSSQPIVATPAPVRTNTPGGGTPTPIATAVANQSAFTCPTSATGSELRTTPGQARRAVSNPRPATVAPSALEVTYATSTTTRAGLAGRENALGARFSSEIASLNGRTTRLVMLGGANPATLAASLRAQAGVLAVTTEGARRHKMSVTTPYYGNDPYFNGFASTVAPSAGATTPPATYHVAPYSESNDVPGQWNFHAIGLEYAQGYSQAGNGSGITNANALGSSSIKIGIVDTGADTTIPELAGKFVYQHCFLTNPSGVQSQSSFVTDPDGHGTDVAGIAASNTNNGIGFASAGGNVSIVMERVEPTPDDACVDESTSGNDPQCSSDVSDVAAAINDAVNQGVNVISISLGGGGCSNGVDGDSLEQAAVSNALNHNIIVVASAGNDGANTVGSLAAPACITGVIAAGATSLADGVVTGSGTSSGSAAKPIEYVASYSQYGSPSSAIHNANAWGIVAPGGDPADAEASANGVVDDLHWIEDTWTSMPFDTNYAGNCAPDYPGTVQTDQQNSCRTLIAGTSMSAPTISGSVARILAVNASYQSPSKMKQLLCQTADEINDVKEGCGRLNLYRAMATALGDPNLP